MREDHESHLDDAIRRLLEAFTGREDVAAECVHLRALVDGLNAALSRGSVTLAQAQACLTAHLRLLPGRSGEGLSPAGA
jgi:hypothetical protein